MKLTNNLSFESLIQMYEEQYEHRYDEYQLEELKRGYDIGLDISIYANTAFDRVQMSIIRLGLENNIDINKYAFVEYNYYVMETIYDLLNHGAYFDRYVLRERLDVDKLIRDHDKLCARTGLRPLSNWGRATIEDGAPYYVIGKGES